MAPSKDSKQLSEYYKLSPKELTAAVNRLKKEKNALLLVHNYQRMEIQRLGDFVGDSLQLAQQAVKTENQLIVLCGVRFMAESAKILNPQKRVILPDPAAGCPMADTINADQLREFKNSHPGAAVVCYVNSSAEVKAESDLCCTSSNAVKIVKSLGNQRILFVPDKNLASYAKKMTGADIVPWSGSCYVHNQFTLRDVMRARALQPKACVVVHPECPPDVADAADKVASTSGMLEFVDKAPQTQFIIGTELGLIEQLRGKYPEKEFFPLRDQSICVNMKKTDLAKLAKALETEECEITVPEEIRKKAFTSLQRMVET